MPSLLAPVSKRNRCRRQDGGTCFLSDLAFPRALAAGRSAEREKEGAMKSRNGRKKAQEVQLGQRYGSHVASSVATYKRYRVASYDQNNFFKYVRDAFCLRHTLIRHDETFVINANNVTHRTTGKLK